MGYAGKVFQIPCNKGGFSNNENIDLIDPTMFISPSRNINLHRNGREKRGGTTKINETAVSGAPRINGIFDFRLTATSYQVFGASDGKIYRDSTTVLKTGMSALNKFNFEVFGNELYVCDGATTPQTWDGAAASTSNITTPSADWSGSVQPFQMIAHGRGASRRMWALLGNAVYYSSLGNGKVFSGGTSGKITLDVRDTYGLVGGVEFGNRLMVFSRDQAFVINDESTDVAEWGYELAPWKGGAVHWRLIIKTPNDLAVFSEDGDIYSIAAVQDYGDYKQASLARPAFVDNWIRDNVDLAYIQDFHGVYDSTLRAIKFFVVRTGQTEIDTALVYFVDRGPEEGWAIHDNQNYDSGYKASCSTYVRVSSGRYSIYTGDYDGFLWKLEQSSRSDNDNPYYGGFKLPHLTFENPRLSKHYRRCYVIARTEGDYNLQVNVWVDGQFKTNGLIQLSGQGGVLDSFILDTDQLGGGEFLDRRLDLGYTGKRIQLEFFNSNAAQTFFISQVLVDFKPLSVRQ